MLRLIREDLGEKNYKLAVASVAACFGSWAVWLVYYVVHLARPEIIAQSPETVKLASFIIIGLFLISVIPYGILVLSLKHRLEKRKAVTYSKFALYNYALCSNPVIPTLILLLNYKLYFHVIVLPGILLGVVSFFFSYLLLLGTKKQERERQKEQVPSSPDIT